jgi:transcriptional regulator with XRE-family HTH domain
MPRPPHIRRPPQIAPLYLGQWLARLGIKPVELCRGTGLTDAYVSELISGKKINPSFNAIRDIADFLGVRIDELRRPPPPDDAVQSVGGLSPSTLDRLKATTRKH